MSRLPFELLLALRYLRPKRTFVSIITLISVLGVTLGVAVLIIVISVMTGFDNDLRQKVLGFNPHLRITQLDPGTGRQTYMTDYSVIAGIVKSNQNVLSVAPFVVGRVLVETEHSGAQSQQADAPVVRGVEPSSVTNLDLLRTNLIGSLDLSGRSVIVGRDFASEMDVTIGDRLAVYSPQDLQKMRDSYNKGEKEHELIPPSDYEVRGIFDTGYYEYNRDVLITSLGNAQDLYNLDDSVHGLTVMLADPYRATEVRAELTKALGHDFYISTWSEENSAMLAVMVEKNVMLYILFFIVIVAAFGITCTLITFVVLKTREIGVMKALGANARQIMWIFLSQSMVVSVLGVFIGTSAGMLAVAYRNPFLHMMRRLTGLELFPAKIYMFTDLPALIVPGDILIICGGSFVICLLAAAFPAWHASRLKPVEALRHE